MCLAVSFLGAFGPAFVSSWAADAPIRLKPEDVRGELNYQAKVLRQPKISLSDFEAKIGLRDVYSPAEVQTYIDSYKAVPAPGKPTGTEADFTKSGYQGPKTFPWLRIRRSYKDILTGEDPSQGDDQGQKKFDDLQGALFSYTHDFNADTDIWSGEMAVLAPFSWSTGFAPVQGDGLNLSRYGAVPSFSWHQVDDNVNPKGDVDQQTYRLGVFAKLESGYKQLNALTLRGYASYANDQVHDVAVPAGEFEIEPFSDLADKLKIGYRTILWAKDDPAHPHDTAIVAYQFRAIVHGEYGSREREGSAFTGQENDFFRLGPQLQFDLKPFFLSNLSVSLRYQVLPAFFGYNNHNTLFNAAAEWAILKDPQGQRSLSLKISYVDGGLDLTQATAHTLLIGLGAAF